MPVIYINGKFLSQRTTGVQRFAHSIICALDKNLRNYSSNYKFELLAPPGASLIDGLEVICQRHVGHIKKSLVVWEQFELPFYSRGGVLLCLSGSAPFFHNNCVPTIHDAAVYLHSDAYSRLFTFWYQILFRRLVKSSPLILTVSNSSARELEQYLSPANVCVISNSAEHIIQKSADLSVMSDLSLIPQKFFLAVGSFNPTKNFLNLIKAYLSSELLKSIPLVIVGAKNHDVFKSMGNLIDHPNIIWSGFLSDSKLRALYEQATLFIFPSYYEGFGIPPLEAMHCGCPVVASNASSIPEVCGDAAVYFNPYDYQDMAQCIEKVLLNKSLQFDLIELGKVQIKNYSWDKSAKYLKSVLEKFKIMKH